MPLVGESRRVVHAAVGGFQSLEHLGPLGDRRIRRRRRGRVRIAYHQWWPGSSSRLRFRWPRQALLHRLHVASQHHHIREPRGRIFVQQLRDQPIELLGRLRREPSHRFGLGESLQLQHFGHRFSAKRRPTCQEREHYAAQRVLVAPVAHRPPVDLLRRHVIGCAQNAACGGKLRGPEQSGDPEVGDLHPIALGHEQVGRLNVAVHDAMIVGVLRAPGRSEWRFLASRSSRSGGRR